MKGNKIKRFELFDGANAKPLRNGSIMQLGKPIDLNIKGDADSDGVANGARFRFVIRIFCRVNGVPILDRRRFVRDSVDSATVSFTTGTSFDVFELTRRGWHTFRITGWTHANPATTTNIASSTNTRPIVITSNNHGLTTGHRVRIQGSTTNPEANGDWTVTFVTKNKFSLDHSLKGSASGTDGTWTPIASVPVSKPFLVRTYRIKAIEQKP